MKKLHKSLLVLSLAAVGAAEAATNKTAMAPRPEIMNLALEGATWHSQINHRIKDEDDKFGASLQAVAFYNESTGDNDRGKYFGFDNKRTLYAMRGANSGAEIDSRHFIFNSGIGVPPGSDNYLTGSINLEFGRKAAGVQFYYFQDLDSIAKGMYLKVRAPIVWEETDARINLAGSNAQYADNTASDSSRTIADYFSGNITQTGSGTSGPNKQTALQAGKINGKHSKTSLANIDVILGWNFLEKEDHHVGINAAVTLPTSSDRDGAFVFEPNGGGMPAWALGAGLDGHFTPWEKDHHKLVVDLAADYRYRFENKEKRVLGVNNKNWGQYMLVGKVGEKGVQPAANILNQKVKVRQGSMFDSRLALNYQYKGFSIDLGYGLYAREREDVSGGSLEADKYAYTDNNYNAEGDFATGDRVSVSDATIAEAKGASSTGSYINTADLDHKVAETEGETTHKLYGSLGYAFNEWDTPLMLKATAHYEFADKQDAIPQWGIAGGIGISF